MAWHRESRRHREAALKRTRKKISGWDTKDYWGKHWRVGERVYVTDGDYGIGYGKIIGFTSDINFANIKLESGKVVTAYKGYCYKLGYGMR